MNDWCPGPRLEPTTNERVEAVILKVLTCPGQELGGAQEDLRGVLESIEWDCKALALRADLAARSIFDEDRILRWLTVRDIARSVAMSVPVAAGKADDVLTNDPQENVT
jgi:hypothetical protein